MTGKKVVVSFNNKRDFYQVPIGLHERGLLKCLYTDTYCPSFIYELFGFMPIMSKSRLALNLLGRYDERLNSSNVRSVGLFAELRGKATELVGLRVDHPTRNNRTSYLAVKYAMRVGSSVFLYSYGWEGAMKAVTRASSGKLPSFHVFQVHPLASQVKKALTHRPDIYRPELEETQDSEMEEAYIAFLKQIKARVICASDYVRNGLVAAGLNTSDVTVVPYGLLPDRRNIYDGKRADRRKSSLAAADRKLRLLFCGSLIYRKGISYLLAALDQLSNPNIELTIISRYLPDSSMIESLPNIRLLQSPSDEKLLQEMQEAHLFVLPSLCEGFGLVYAESLSVGTPVMCTPNTGIFDFVEHGVNGFVVSPGDVSSICEVLEWCVSNTGSLREMRDAAIHLSRSRTWEDFRRGIAEVVSEGSHEP